MSGDVSPLSLYAFKAYAGKTLLYYFMRLYNSKYNRCQHGTIVTSVSATCSSWCTCIQWMFKVFMKFSEMATAWK